MHHFRRQHSFEEFRRFVVRFFLNFQFRQTNVCLQPKETIFHISKTTESNISLPPFTHVKYRDQRINYKPVQFPIPIERPVISNCHRVTPIREQRPITDNTTVEDTYRPPSPICEQPSYLEREREVTGKVSQKKRKRERLTFTDRLFDNRPKIDPLYSGLFTNRRFQGR